MLGQSVTLPQVHRFELVDCDDAAFGTDGDLYLACHSPQGHLLVAVRGPKSTPDEMDAYVLRLNPRTGSWSSPHAWAASPTTELGELALIGGDIRTRLD